VKTSNNDFCTDGFGPTNPSPKKQTRRGTDSAPRLACFWGSAAQWSAVGCGAPPLPEGRPIPTIAAGGLPAAKLADVTYKNTSDGSARLMLQLARQPRHIVGRKVGGNSTA